jgi:hypothetical protein
MKRQPSSLQISIFAQGPAFCAVCAPLTMRRGVIEIVVALRNRGEPEAKWKAAEGPFSDGRTNPRSCPYDVLRQHWLLTRVRQTERRSEPNGPGAQGN